MPSRSEEELRRRIAEGSQDLDDVDLSDALAGAGRFEESLAILEQTLPLTLSTLDRARRAVEIGWRLHDGVPDGLPRAQACAEEAVAALTDESDMPPALALRGAARSLLAHCVSWTDRPASLPLARQALRTLEAAGRQPPTFRWMRWVPYDAARVHVLLEEGEPAVSTVDGSSRTSKRWAPLRVARDHYRLVLDAPAATDAERAEAGEGLDRLS